MNAASRLFLTVDGPGGVGKSTVVRALVDRLTCCSVPVYPTAEPSKSPMGDLARFGTDSFRGLTLAHLVSADRYHHLYTEIRPRLAAGDVVICDRYLASSLVLQRIDGVPLRVIQEINWHIERPDLTVILTADPEVIADRLARRGAHSRFERTPGNTAREITLYQEATKVLTRDGNRVLTVDTTTDAPEAIARRVLDVMQGVHFQVCPTLSAS